MEEAFKRIQSLVQDMERPFNRRFNYLETYLEEHPREDSPLTQAMRDELQKGNTLSKDQYASYKSTWLQVLYREAKKIRKREKEEREAAYRAQWKGYTLELHIPTPFNKEHDTLDVKITRQDGEEYQLQCITIRYLEDLFEKNQRTGECASGTYVWMPGMVVLDREISEETVRITIDDLIEGYSMEHFHVQKDN